MSAASPACLPVLRRMRSNSCQTRWIDDNDDIQHTTHLKVVSWQPVDRRYMNTGRCDDGKATERPVSPTYLRPSALNDEVSVSTETTDCDEVSVMPHLTVAEHLYHQHCQ